MANLAVTFIVLLIVGTAAAYIVKEKRRGVKCIGCPAAGNCSGSKTGQCSGSCHAKTEEDRENH